MSAPRPVLPATLSTCGYHDGLGRRSLAFDRESGTALERLAVRPEFVAFERPLRERADRLAAFDDERFARIRGIELDHGAGRLTVVSEFVAGNRLSHLIEDAAERARDETTAPSVDAAIGFLLQALPAFAALHGTGHMAHGAVAPDRIVLTPAGQIVLLDSIFAEPLQRLHFSRQRLWTEFGIAAPASAGHVRMDGSLDVSQCTLIALAMTIGRPLAREDYPGALNALMGEALEIAQLRGSAAFASAFQRFFARALPLASRRPFASAEDASAAVDQLARDEMGLECCRAALVDLAREPVDVAPPVPLPVVLPDAVLAASPASDAGSRGSDEVPKVESPLELTTAAPAAAISAAPIPSPPVIEAHDEPAPAPPPIEIPAEPALAPTLEFHAEAAPPPAAIEIHAEPAPPPRPVESHSEPVAAAIESRAESAQLPEAETDPEFAAAIAAAESVAPAAPAAPEPESPPPQAGTPEPKRKRQRGGKRHRDRLRSADTPPPAPVRPEPVIVARPAPPVMAATPTIPAPAAAPPPMPAPPMPTFAAQVPLPAPPMPVHPPLPAVPAFNHVPDNLWMPSQAPVALAPVAAPAAPQPPAPVIVRVKSEPPAGFEPPEPARARGMHFGDTPEPRGPLFRAPRGERRSGGRWKLAAAALVVIAAGAAAGRAYLPSRIPEMIKAPVTTAAPPAPPVAPERTGTLVVETQPAGARVLIDGKPAGETPLKLDAVAVGQHIVTLSTSSATVKRSVRVEAGKTAAIDVAVYSGWLAVFAPIVLDIAERGQSLGTTEHGRLMLPPGRHALTLSNRELGYSAVHKVDIDPGEERVLTVEPRGPINLNAQPWAEVFIDGERAGETPIANLQVPLGTHEIVFKHPQFGERRVTTVVTALAPATVTIDFTKSQD